MLRRIVLQRCFAALLLVGSLCVAHEASAQNRDTFRPIQDAPRRQPKDAGRNARAETITAFVQRLMEVEPSRRQELLDNNRRFQRLPEAQRQAIQDRLREFDKLPPERRESLIQRFQLFSSLGPNQQTQARSLFREWSALPRPRRVRIAQAVRRLRNAQPEARDEMLASERFQRLFDESDRSLIEKLLELASSPQDAPR